MQMFRCKFQNLLLDDSFKKAKKTGAFTFCKKKVIYNFESIFDFMTVESAKLRVLRTHMSTCLGC